METVQQRSVRVFINGILMLMENKKGLHDMPVVLLWQGHQVQQRSRSSVTI